MKLAILMSTFNGGKYIDEQVASILNQDYTAFRLIIRDDGSTFPGFISYLKKLPGTDNRIRVIFGENIGVKNSFFKLLNDFADEYDYIALADQDDYWYPQKISNAMDLLNGKQDTPVICFSASEITDERLNPVGIHPAKHFRSDIRHILCENQTAGCTMVFSRPAAKYALITQQFHRIYMHDWWLMIIGTFFGEIIYDPRPQVKYRQHSGNVLGGTSSLVFKFVKRIKRAKKRNSATTYISRQAGVLLDDYKNMLRTGQVAALEELVSAKTSFLKRLNYCLSKQSIRRSSRLDNLIFRFLILLNQY